MALTDSLIRYYKLDEPSGTTVTDATGTQNGTNSGLTVNQTGKINTGYGGDGAGTDQVNISLTSPANFTVAMWVKFTSVTGTRNQHIYSSGADGTNIMRLGVNSAGKPYFGLYDAGDKDILGGSALSNGVWYYFVATYGATGMQLKVNDVSQGTNAYTGNGQGNQAMYLGNIQSSQAHVFNGIIDEVAIWDRQISSAEMTELYNSGAGFAYPFITPPQEEIFDDSFSLTEDFSYVKYDSSIPRKIKIRITI